MEAKNGSGDRVGCHFMKQRNKGKGMACKSSDEEEEEEEEVQFPKFKLSIHQITILFDPPLSFALLFSFSFGFVPILITIPLYRRARRVI